MAVYSGEKAAFVGGLGAMTGIAAIGRLVVNVGSEVPDVGETINGATSNATGVVVAFGSNIGGGGSWSGAFGKIVLSGVTGTFQAEDIHDSVDNVIGDTNPDPFGFLDFPANTTPAFLQNRGSSFALSDIMGGNGQEWNTGNNGPFATTNNGGLSKITLGVDCTNLVGALVVVEWVDFSGNENGLYEILSADATSITIDDDIGGGGTVLCWIGGAWPGTQSGLQDALDNLSAASYNQYILTNSPMTLSAAIDIDTGGGVKASNLYKRIIGFNTIPPTNTQMDNGDMDLGGEFYESPIDNLVAGSIDATKSVSIVGNAGAYKLFIVTVDNISFKNLHVHNNTGSNAGISIESAKEGIAVLNCKFTDVIYPIKPNGQSSFYDSCYSGSGVEFWNFQSVQSGHNITNCVFDTPAGKIGWMGRFSTLTNCIFVGGGTGVTAQWAVQVNNCTFYNQTTYCLYVNGPKSCLVEFNNIFFTSSRFAYAVYINSGSILYSDYSLAYTAAGNFADNPWHDNVNSADIQGANSTKNVDPLFADAAGGDFRLLPTSPCLHAGKYGMSMGMEQRKQYPMRIKTDGLI